MTEEEKELRLEIIKRAKIAVDQKDFFERTIQISPIAGRHEMPAGFTIAVSGTPPKGIIICFVSSGGAWIGYIYSLQSMRFAFDTSSINPKKNNPFGRIVLNYLRIIGHTHIPHAMGRESNNFGRVFRADAISVCGSGAG